MSNIQNHNTNKPKIAQPIGGTAAEKNHIKYVIAILSGKGGVGKSLVTGLLASALARSGNRVGVLDADITGPSIPMLFGLHGPVQTEDMTIIPLKSRTGIKVMSMNLLIDKEDAPIIWRGPLISQAIKQLFSDVFWGDMDYLLVDLPPGTSDATLTIMQSLPLKGAIIITTPQSLAGLVVTKTIHMSQHLNVPILGIVENMAYFVCPETGVKHYIFGPSHVNDLTDEASAPLMARIPIDPAITALCDAGCIEDVILMETDKLVHTLLFACEEENITEKLEQTSAPLKVEPPFSSADQIKPVLHAEKEEITLEEFSEIARELVVSKENWGVLDAPDARMRIRGCCGDSMQLDLQIENDSIIASRFLTDGCSASIAAAGMVSKMAKGKTLDQALQLTQQEVLDALGGLPGDHQHCAKLAVMTLHQTINIYLSEKR